MKNCIANGGSDMVRSTMSEILGEEHLKQVFSIASESGAQ